MNPTPTELVTTIPVFNGERFLPATLACLAAQTRKPDRVVVIDNGSTDRTAEIVQSFRDLPCEFRRNDHNLGVLGNLNRCLQFSRETRFLHLLMSDDIVKPTFYERMLPVLGSSSTRGLAYCFHENISKDGTVLKRVQGLPEGPPRAISLKRFLIPQSECRTVILPGVVFKTDFQPPVCEFPNMPQVGDGLFLAEWAVASGAVFEIREYLCQYRLHPFSASSRHIYNLQAFVRDEWDLSRRIRGWIHEPLIPRLLRRFRLWVLYSARVQVKIDMMQRLQPEFADEIRRYQIETFGRLGAAAGRGVVRARDLLRIARGRPVRVDELLTTTV
jgi:glycosyltransferase involved in cell wall biosynthesis